MSKIYKVLFPIVIFTLFVYLFNFKERVVHSPEFFVGKLVGYSCWKGRAKGQLDLTLEIDGKKQKFITSLFGYTRSGWIQCEDLKLSERLGEIVIFGDVGVGWAYLKIGNVEVHSLEALIKQVESSTSTRWGSGIDWDQVVVPK